MSLVFSPLVSDQIVVVVVDMLARAKLPARLSSPDARSTPPRSLEQRTETAEANHLQFLLAKKGRAEELGSRRVDAALSKRSEKEVAAMRALAAKMASSDELLNTSRKIQMLKFEKARFLRQAARDARAKLDEAVADANAHAKLKVERASAKHSQLLAGVAHANALKIARAKEISAKTKAMLSLEAAEQALLAKMAAATARVDATLEARLSPVKAHNERVRSVAGRQQAQRSAAAAELELSARKREAVAESKHNEAIASKVAKAANTVERAASQAKNAAEQAELSRARIVHAMFVRLQAAESKRAALLATPTKQSRACARTRDLESRHLGTAAQGLSFVEEPKRAISDALESRLLRPADADDVVRALNLTTAAERAAANCARAIGTKASLLEKLAAAHARVPAAQAQRATAAAALAAGLAAVAAAAGARLAARAAGRAGKAAAAAARRAAAAQCVLEWRSVELASAAEAADKVLSASGRAAAAVCSVRTQAFRAVARAALAAGRRVALKARHAARASSEAGKALEAATARAEHLKAITERAGALAGRRPPRAEAVAN
ncbi:hypothetical protein T492DRAFT_875867 [Pavlovales sp. CCMP2436]|nr:hypothetical protein T492DRAFT_875867 [Pavlovales sp. CCMP2436]